MNTQWPSSRTTRRRALLKRAGTAGIAAGVGIAAMHATAALGQEEMPVGIVGVWLVTNATPGSTPNATLVQFFPNGGFMRAGTGHLSETPGFGAWTQTGPTDFDLTYITVRVDKDGAFDGHRKSWLRITLDASRMSWSAQTRGTMIDKQGVQAPLGAPGRNGGVRLVTEPFPDEAG